MTIKSFAPHLFRAVWTLSASRQYLVFISGSPAEEPGCNPVPGVPEGGDPDPDVPDPDVPDPDVPLEEEPGPDVPEDEEPGAGVLEETPGDEVPDDWGFPDEEAVFLDVRERTMETVLARVLSPVEALATSLYTYFFPLTFAFLSR